MKLEDFSPEVINILCKQHNMSKEELAETLATHYTDVGWDWEGPFFIIGSKKQTPKEAQSK